MKGFVSLVFFLMLVIALAQQEGPFIRPTFVQITDINEEYSIVYSFIHPSSKFTVTVAPDYFVNKFTQVTKQSSAVEENTNRIYIQLENTKKINIESMEQFQTPPIVQYKATNLVYSNLNDKNQPNIQSQGLKNQQKQKINKALPQQQLQILERQQKLSQKNLLLAQIQGFNQQSLIQEQGKAPVPHVQGIPNLQSQSLQTYPKIEDNKKNEQTAIESNRLILIVAVAIFVIIICLLVAVCFNRPQNANLWQKIGNRPHETIVVNQEDQQQIGISQNQIFQDNSLNDELN